ncbi:MAG: response regulator [Candidatus Aminicenantales bacterium]
MEKLTIICLDDQREVLAALKKDLAVLEERCAVVGCESVDETLEVLNDLDKRGEEPALLICDHVMPGKSGIDFLVEIRRDGRFERTKRILLTGLATHQDTIEAINKARIDYYIEKPWDPKTLVQSARRFLTQFVLESGLEYKDYLPVLDQETLFKGLA